MHFCSVFTGGRDQQYLEQERQLRGRISELEATVRADVATRNEILEKLAAEISKCMESWYFYCNDSCITPGFYKY